MILTAEQLADPKFLYNDQDLLDTIGSLTERLAASEQRRKEAEHILLSSQHGKLALHASERAEKAERDLASAKAESAALQADHDAALQAVKLLTEPMECGHAKACWVVDTDIAGVKRGDGTWLEPVGGHCTACEQSAALVAALEWTTPRVEIESGADVRCRFCSGQYQFYSKAAYGHSPDCPYGMAKELLNKTADAKAWMDAHDKGIAGKAILEATFSDVHDAVVDEIAEHVRHAGLTCQCEVHRGMDAQIARARLEIIREHAADIAKFIWDEWCGPGTRGMPGHDESVRQLVKLWEELEELRADAEKDSASKQDGIK